VSRKADGNDQKARSLDDVGGCLSAADESGTIISQSSTRAAVRSTDTVTVVKDKLDQLYVVQKGCTSRAAVNKPRDYFCFNAATRKTDEVYITFAALDLTAADASISQSSVFLVKG
jgi:hypothetical protein